MKYAFCTILIFAIISCQKTTAPIDPCLSVEKLDVGIVIDEFAGDSITVDTDSVVINSSVTFRAVLPKGRFASVKWKVGDFESSDKEFTLSFFRPGVRSGLEVPVQLIAEVNSSSCFPQEKTRDTAYRTLRVIDVKDSRIIGKYRGLFAKDLSRKDTQTVEIRWIPPDNVFEDGLTAVYNVPKGCNSFASNPNNKYWYMIETNGVIGNNFRLFATQNSFENGCLAPIAYLKLKPNDKDSLIVDYFYSKSASEIYPKIQDQFRGRRIK